MRLSRTHVLDTLVQHRAELVRLGVKRIGLFGSSARDESRPDSDLDFVVALESRTFDTYMNLRIFLEDLFQTRIDLVTEETIKPRLRERILAEAAYAPGL